jgi:hypothetical protein
MALGLLGNKVLLAVFWCFVRRLLEEIEPMTHLLIEQEKRKVEFLGLVVSVLF